MKTTFGVLLSLLFASTDVFACQNYGAFQPGRSLSATGQVSFVSSPVADPQTRHAFMNSATIVNRDGSTEAGVCLSISLQHALIDASVIGKTLTYRTTGTPRILIGP